MENMGTAPEQLGTLPESPLKPAGIVLAILAGAAAAAGGGFLYHLTANKLGIDFIIAIAVVLGALVGLVVGLAARAGGLRVGAIVMLIAFVLGVGAYSARYYFEFNDFVNTTVQEFRAVEGTDLTDGEIRQLVLEVLDDEYPPGGFVGYLSFVSDMGFSIGERGSEQTESMLQGGAAWALLAVEALAAGIAAAGTSRRSI